MDMWLVFEIGGSSLSKSLYDLKGEFFKGERVYSVNKNIKGNHNNSDNMDKFYYNYIIKL